MNTMNVPGYASLATVLNAAYLQAATGKGADRHAKGQPFDEQTMQVGADQFGVGSLLFQAFKKSEESQRLPHEAAVKELLGAINYLAGAVIALGRHEPKIGKEEGVMYQTGTPIGMTSKQKQEANKEDTEKDVVKHIFFNDIDNLVSFIKSSLR